MNKIKNFISNSIFHAIVLCSIFLFLIYAINTNLSFNIDYLKHWSTYHRDDIVFIYNSLLYTEGLEQHHLDHPSLFTFIIFPFFYKLFFYIGYLDFYNLSGFLQSENINLSLSKLFYISRVVIQIFSLGIIFLIYKIISKFSMRNIDAFFLSILFIISTGFTSASNRVESGLIAVFFLLLSFHLFLKFIESKNKKNIIYFAFAFIFIFSAMMQKKIVYFAVPFIFLSSIMLLKKNEIIYNKFQLFKNNSIYKYLLFALYFLVFFFITYKTLINNTFFLARDLDFVFLILNYAGLNILLFLYIKYYQQKYYQNLLTYNLIFGFIYFVYKYFLIYFFSAPVSIWSISFTNFLGHLNMFVSGENVKGAFDFGSINLYYFTLLSNIKFVIKKYFFTYNYQSILLWFNLLLFIFYLTKTTVKEKISISSLFFGFLIVQSIMLFRYEQDTYYLNSEFFLLFSACIIIKYLKINKSYLFIAIILMLLLLNSNIKHLKKIKIENSTSYCSRFENFEEADKFYEYWTSKFPIEVRKKFCSDFNL